MSVDLFDNDSPLTITANREDAIITLQTSVTDSPFTIPQFIPDVDEPNYRSVERETQFYLDITTGRSPHPVIELINSLPTPMFLDLERRARFAADTDHRRPGWVRATRRAPNIFNFTLTESLLHATSLAEGRYRELVTRLGRIGEESRRDMVLSLLTMSREEVSANFSVPTATDRANLKTLRDKIAILPNILQVSRAEVDRRISPFLERLEAAINALPSNFDINQFFTQPFDHSNQPLRDQVMWWAANQDNVRKFNEILRAVEAYNLQRDHESQQINQYLATLNEFLNDSQKTLQFDNVLNLVYTIKGVQGERQITTFSSGEAQLFVILTHLFFNPAAQRANVFIIDEPELSLHVQWQELFLDSMRTANPRVQYILSTHSPSIILDRIDKCVDLSTTTVVP
jgi:predicted ATPase